MRIVQIIDSLQPGGAERMAVNYANALSKRIEFSGLITTRKEGGLKSEISPNVHYQYLHKKSATDIGALLRLRHYCRQHDIKIMHAHGTSFFIAAMIKLILPRIAIVWHDHNGDRINQASANNRLLSICARLFSGIIVVNKALETWARQNLHKKSVIYLPNFTVADTTAKSETQLRGKAGCRILLLANLRQPKNHHFAVRAAAKLKAEFPQWTYHFVGNDFNDTYSESLKRLISEHNLNETVYIYGLKLDVPNVISQCDICLLTSEYEGLPVALIEYGMGRKPVVVTAVGEIPNIIHNDINGYVVAVDDVVLLSDRLRTLMQNSDLRERLGNALYTQFQNSYSEDYIMQQYTTWLREDVRKMKQR